MNTNAIESMKEVVLGYVEKNVLGASIESDTPIFELGYVNSLFAIELMSFIENNFKVKIRTADLDLNNFRTVDDTCNFINKKLQAAE